MRNALRCSRSILWVGLGWLALAGLPGCVTSPGPEPENLRWRKARAYYDIGIDHMNHGRPAMAIRELTRAQDIDSSDRWISLALAEAYRRRGHVEEAERLLRRALEIEPSFQAARLNLGALYLQAERYEEAIPLLEALAAEPTFPDPWRALTNLGWARYKLGGRAAARRHLEQAVEYHPGYWPALLNLGILAADEGHSLEALESFRQVVQEKPGRTAEAEAHYRMAEIFITLGQRERAIEHLTASRERHPRGLWGKRSAEYLNILR